MEGSIPRADFTGRTPGAAEDLDVLPASPKATRLHPAPKGYLVITSQRVEVESRRRLKPSLSGFRHVTCPLEGRDGALTTELSTSDRGDSGT
jgi:hypothetical protein